MKPYFKRNLNLVLLVAVILASFGLGALFGKSQVVCEVCQPADINFSLFWEAYNKLKENFVDSSQINEQDVLYGAISGMVKSLGDPYTVFFPPEETKRFIEDVKGVFEGVGMEIDIRQGQLQVVAPLEGTPADKAGLRAGDKILKVDDSLTADLTIEEAVELIRGPRGTDVVLTIFRDEWDETREVTVTRGVIEVPSLRWELINSSGQADSNGDIAYIKLYQFTEKAAFDFRVAAIDILNTGAKKIILDLRNNPGGYLEVARDIAGWFLQRDNVVVVEEFGDGSRNIHKAEGNEALLSHKVVILINKGSASGSEILAGALRDNRGIQLIGEKSFGKGSVQSLERLRGGSTLKITIAKWLTPNGDLITDVGLSPDIAVDMSTQDYEEDRDPQLNKAIEVINAL